MRKNDEKHGFKAVLDIIREHRDHALASVNVEHLLSCWQIGGVLSAKIKQDGWGRATIDRLVAGVYEALSSEDFTAHVLKYARLIVQPSAGQLRSMPEVNLEALDRDVRRQNENPPIGILRRLPHIPLAKRAPKAYHPNGVRIAKQFR